MNKMLVMDYTAIWHRILMNLLHSKQHVIYVLKERNNRMDTRSRFYSVVVSNLKKKLALHTLNRKRNLVKSRFLFLVYRVEFITKYCLYNSLFYIKMKGL